MPKRDRRAEIMQAAENLFTSRRFHEVTLDSVVQAAGVGKGTIYRYFRDKDELFFETATRGFDELCDLLSRKVPTQGPFRRQLLSACREISAFFGARRQLFGMMQSEAARMQWVRGDMRQRWLQRRRKLVTAVAGIVARGAEAGLIRQDVPAEVLANFLLGMLRTRSRDLADVPEEHKGHDLVVKLFCEGATAPLGAAARRAGARTAGAVRAYP